MNKEVEITVSCFAGLRKYFAATETVKCTLPATCDEILEKMLAKNPEASVMLSKCRIAIGEQFVPQDFVLTENVVVFLIPPSSGG